MSLNECSFNNGVTSHKFGPFIRTSDGYSRFCRCCGKKSVYPFSESIEAELKKQDDYSQIFGYIIQESPLKICGGSDDFIRLLSVVLDSLSYLYVNEDSIEKFRVNVKNGNSYFNGDGKDAARFSLVNDFLGYFDSFFKKEALEIKGVVVGDEIYKDLDLSFESIANRFDDELGRLYDLNKFRKK